MFNICVCIYTLNCSLMSYIIFTICAHKRDSVGSKESDVGVAWRETERSLQEFPCLLGSWNPLTDYVTLQRMQCWKDT